MNHMIPVDIEICWHIHRNTYSIYIYPMHTYILIKCSINQELLYCSWYGWNAAKTQDFSFWGSLQIKLNFYVTIFPDTKIQSVYMKSRIIWTMGNNSSPLLCWDSTWNPMSGVGTRVQNRPWWIRARSEWATDTVKCLKIELYEEHQMIVGYVYLTKKKPEEKCN